RRHCVVREEAANDLAQPLSLFSDRSVPAPSHLLPHLHELCSHAVAPALALEQEAPSTGLTADEGKAQKLEGLRFTELTSSALLRSETAELDQTGLVRMKRQRKSPQPFPHRVQEAPGTHRVKERLDVGVQYEVHLPDGNPDAEGV